jgi:hypothetical protein
LRLLSLIRWWTGCTLDVRNPNFRDAVTGLFVPFLWYFVGGLIGNRDSARLHSYTWARNLWACLGVFALSAVAALVGASFLFISPREFLVVRVCTFGWIGFGILTLVARMRRGRAATVPGQ